MGRATLAEVWNGSNWSIQPTPNPAGVTSSLLNDVSCISASRCEAVGQATSGGNVRTLAEEWNGSNWTIKSTQDVGGAVISELSGVSCTAANACEAVGESRTGTNFPALAEKWNGSSWTIQATSLGTFSPLEGVSCTAANACTATGSGLAARWDGSSWTLQAIKKPGGSTGSADLSRVSCTDKTRCMAVGSFPKDAVETVIAEQWDGTSWKIQPTPITTANDSSGLAGVSCTFATACTGVGDFVNASNKVVPLAERWNGTNWSVQSVPAPSGSLSEFSSVSCGTTQFNVGCNAVGFVMKNGIGTPMAENWNGSAWAVKPTPLPDPNVTRSTMTSVSCSSLIACMGVGFIETSTGADVPLGEQYG